MIYRVNEIFHSLKGEGVWLGEPMNFVRMSGCNLSCESCDTHFNEPTIKMSERDILEKLNSKSKKVVITGGEPLIQDLLPLLNLLRREGYSLHLETNGTLCPSEMLGKFDWIAVSPKIGFGAHFEREMFNQADEIKFPILQAGSLEEARKFRKEAKAWKASLVWYLHPWNDLFESTEVWEEGESPPKHREWSSANLFLHSLCTEFALEEGWRVSIQLHKILKIL